MLSSRTLAIETSMPAEKGASFSISLFLSLVVTALLVLPQLASFLLSGGVSPRAFSDWDEPLYLTVLNAVGRDPLALFRGQFPTGIELPLGFPYPHALIDVVVGALTNPLSLSPLELGLIFDAVLIPLAFFALRATFRHLSARPFVPELAATLILTVPWLLPLSRLLVPLFPSLNSGGIILAPYSFYPCPPVLRGVYTQLSYAFFPWVLTLLLRGRTQDRVAAGILTGALLYIYLFSWITFLMVGGILALLLRNNGKKGVSNSVVSAALFLAPALVVSAPGVVFLLSTHSPVQYQLDQGPTWYLPPEIVILLILFCSSANKADQAGNRAMLF